MDEVQKVDAAAWKCLYFRVCVYARTHDSAEVAWCCKMIVTPLSFIFDNSVIPFLPFFGKVS